MTDLIKLAKECRAIVADASVSTAMQRTRVTLYVDSLDDRLTAFAERIRQDEREKDAVLCEEEARMRAEAGLTHPEDSESRSRCFAAARAAENCAAAIRSRKP